MYMYRNCLPYAVFQRSNVGTGIFHSQQLRLREVEIHVMGPHQTPHHSLHGHPTTTAGDIELRLSNSSKCHTPPAQLIERKQLLPRPT